MTKQRHRVIPRTLCIIKNKNKILLIEYSKRKGDLYGFFNALGGHIESDEGIIENAQKEIFEETGLQPETTKLKGIVHINNFFGKKVMMFVTLSETFTADVIESDEGKLHWVDVDEINLLKIFEDIKIILDKLANSKDTEVFTAKSRFHDDGSLDFFEFEN